MYTNKLAKLTLLASLALAGCASTKNVEEVAEVETEAAPVVAEQAPVEEVATAVTSIDNVYFEFDKATISAENVEALKAQLVGLAGQSVKLVVTGHADERGGEQYNIALGQKRAEKVKEILIGEGVDQANIEVSSAGENEPAAMGSDEISHQQNRRVEIEIQ